MDERSGSPTLSDDIEHGDLGLGDGLKPGGLPQQAQDILRLDEHHNDTDKCVTSLKYSNSTNCDSCGCNMYRQRSEDSEQCSEMSTTISHASSCETCESSNALHQSSSSTCKEPENERKNDMRTFSSHSYSDSDSSNTNIWKCDTCSKNSNFPNFADIPCGTSLRQHKKLLEAQLEDIEKKRQHKNTRKSRFNNNKSQDCINAKKCEEIERKLIEAQQELCELKQEFEACQKRLNTKYQAISILQSQLEDKTEDHESKEQKSKELTDVLVKGGGAGGGGSFQRRFSSSSSDELDDVITEEKYHRVCQENAMLMRQLDCRLEELRKYSAINMAVGRERDELLSLMDVQERLKYEKSRISSSDDLENYCTFTAAELAVLGACQCRIVSPEPCGCSHIAVSLKRDVAALSDQIDIYKERSEEAYATVNVYREAFEEQLDRNKQMTLRLAELTSPSLSRTTRAKAALKWLLGSVSADDEPINSPIVVNGSNVKVDLKAIEKSGISEKEVIVALTDMIHDRNNALSHQKLHNQILANKIKILEEKGRSEVSDKHKC